MPNKRMEQTNLWDRFAAHAVVIQHKNGQEKCAGLRLRKDRPCDKVAYAGLSTGSREDRQEERDVNDDRDYSKDPNNPANQSQMERDANRWARTASSGKVGAAVVAMALLEIVVLGAIAWGISRLIGLHDTGLVIYWVAMGVLIFRLVLGRKLRKIRGGR